MTAEITEPSDRDILEVSLKRLSALLWILLDRVGDARIVPSLNREQQSDIRWRSADRSLNAEARRKDILSGNRNASVACAQTKDIIERRWIAQRASVVAAVGDSLHPQRDRNGCPAARTTGGARLIVGVLGCSVDVVVGLRAAAELGGIRLADEDSAVAAQALDHD